jgi:asparagine synthase (glutamine-hydrolysing)
MGVKPFYYYLSDEEFFFATEIKALFKLPEVPHCLNEQKVAFYLMDIDDNKSTFYKDINSFSAAHTMTIHQNNVEIKKYWTLDPESQIIMDSEEEYANKFREIFTEAVKCRLRTAYPIGFELSGGLDSSSIVSIAKKLLNKNGNSCSTNINTFSYIFEHFPVSDESYYIKKVTDTGGIEPQFIYGDKINPLKNMETILWYQEQPFFTPFLEMIYQLYDKMQENDTRIMLSGLGGDAVAYYGVNYLRDLAVNFKWKKLMNELKDYSKNVNIDYLNLFYYTVIIPLIPEIIKRPILVFKKSKLDILNKEFAKRINAKKYLKNLYQDPLKEAKTAKKLHYHILSTDNIYMSEMLDRTNSAFSIEPRYPFLDKRLVEFCYAIPSGMKFKNGWGRYIQRIAMTDILPKENQWRPFKAELTPVLEKNLLLYEKTFLNNLICHNNTKIEKYVDQNTIKNIYQKFINGIAGYDSYKIWFASLLFLWLQKNEF